ncbi:MAG: ABC transporter permease [Tannerella sp.]|jgi:putative ABC transport system permease protein|nr:ABC transporter permease [Tannerella sp.]
MIKQYFKQALQMLRENPLVSVISIVGTALSISMIMVIVLVFRINVAEYKPESHRNRMLFVSGTRAYGENNSNNGQMSAEVIKACFYSLQVPQAVTGIRSDTRPISLPAKRLFKEYQVTYTDAGFWNIFDFTFLHGQPFTEADFQSAIPRAVITSEVATQLFGTDDAIGQTLVLDYTSYTVAGIVEPVSTAAQHAYAEVWIPYTTNAALMENPYHEGISGSFSTMILAHSASDFEKIKEELSQTTERYNGSKRDMKVSFMNNPITQMDIAAGSNGFRKVALSDYFLGMGFLLLFLLLVPALNLTGTIQSSVQKRRAEIGIRKAFGATYRTLVGQIIAENMLTTLIGGLSGLALSFILLPVCKSFMLTDETVFTAEMLFKPELFVAALFFVLALNVLSAGVPAIRISRRNIVEALKDAE